MEEQWFSGRDLWINTSQHFKQHLQVSFLLSFIRLGLQCLLTLLYISQQQERKQITQLSICIEEITSKYNDCLIFIRGDGNVNPNNQGRVKILSSFLKTHSLKQSEINHKTYHHFLGGGVFDSNIDILLYSISAVFPETVSKIFCKHDHPDMDSHHDAILSSVFLPLVPHHEEPQDLITAPLINHPRHKIVWSAEGIDLYQKDVASKLSESRITWLNPLSKTSMAVLLFKTNDILTKAAKETNKVVDLKAN